MKKLHTTIVPATLALMLTACGGGGDDGPPTTGVAPVAERELTRQQALQQDPDANRQALHEAATATPRFESVTQSTSQNVAGVSTDAARASVSIEGAEPRIKVTVTRDDGSTLSLGHPLACDRWSGRQRSNHETLGQRFPAEPQRHGTHLRKGDCRLVV